MRGRPPIPHPKLESPILNPTHVQEVETLNRKPYTLQELESIMGLILSGAKGVTDESDPLPEAPSDEEDPEGAEGESDSDSEARPMEEGEGASAAPSKLHQGLQTFVFSATLTLPEALRKRLKRGAGRMADAYFQLLKCFYSLGGPERCGFACFCGSKAGTRESPKSHKPYPTVCQVAAVRSGAQPLPT